MQQVVHFRLEGGACLLLALLISAPHRPPCFLPQPTAWFYVAGAAINSSAVANAVGSIYCLVSILLSGFLRSNEGMPVLLQYVSQVSFVSHAFEALLINEFGFGATGFRSEALPTYETKAGQDVSCRALLHHLLWLLPSPHHCAVSPRDPFASLLDSRDAERVSIHGSGPQSPSRSLAFPSTSARPSCHLTRDPCRFTLHTPGQKDASKEIGFDVTGDEVLRTFGFPHNVTLFGDGCATAGGSLPWRCVFARDVMRLVMLSGMHLTATYLFLKFKRAGDSG